MFAVEMIDDDDRAIAQLAAFESEQAARECLALLQAEGRHGKLAINLITVHVTVEEWARDR